MKFKGQSVRGPTRQYSLKEQLGEGGFSVIYNTADPETICKVQVLSNPEIMKAYKNEKQALQQLQHKNIVQLKDSFELKQKDGYFGFLFMQNCNSGNAWNILDGYGQNDVPQKLVLKIAYYTVSAIEYMHKKGISHRDIKLQNVLINSKGQYKLCDFGSSSRDVIKNITKQNREDIQQYIEKTTTPLYRAPQQLDLYSGYQIGTKVDVFALGVMMFILCFKKPPFESRLSAINKQYFVPEQTSYSSELISLIEKCFTTNPNERLTATEAKIIIQTLMERKVAQLDLVIEKQLDATLSEIIKINNQMLKKSTPVAESSFFDRIKLIYNQMTTQTEGWIASFVEDNQQAPQLKYNRSIISKCWQKRYKAQKMYQILYKYSQDYKPKCLVNLKLLILLHNFLRKGPPQSINYDGKYSAAKLSTKIYKNWKLYQRATDPDDIKRNSYVCLVIRHYSLILAAKWKLCYQYSDLIEGNFSILPFFQSKKQVALLKLPFICELIHFLDMCAEFHEILATKSYLVEIQRSIILSLVDEEYCCISLLVFLLCSFKEAICHLSDDLDLQKLSQKLKYVEKDFESVFKKLSKLFQSVNKLASLFDEDTSFSLSLKILQRIKGINIREKKPGNFQFKKHINYERSIQGLKIPLSYQQAVKNPNFLKSLQRKDSQNTVEMNQFKIKKNNQQAQNNMGNQQNSNEAFKKNKDHKIFQNNVHEGQIITSNKNIILGETRASIGFMDEPKNNHKHQQMKDLKQSRFEMMEFTHQNLNKDMNSQIREPSKQSQQPKKYTTEKKQPSSPQQDQFKNFLSIVDEQFSQSYQSQFTTKHRQPPVVKANNQKDPKIKEIFNSFSNMADDSKSKISSVNSNNNLWAKGASNNIFNQSFQSVGAKSNDKSFQAFGSIVGNEQVSSSKKQQEKKSPQVTKKLQNSVQKQIIPIQPNVQDNTVYSSISSISKDVYNSLNNAAEEQAKKVELMNFFDDDEDEEPSKQNKNKDNLLQDASDDQDLNKTSPQGFMRNSHLLENRNRDDHPIKSEQQLLGEVKFGETDERLFKTMPVNHSFIDLKGFIVEQVKKNAQQYFIDFSTLKFFGKVGFGHSSEVFKGEWRGRQVAIKRIKDNMSPSNAKQFKREIMTSVKIRHHPNLVTLIGIAEYQNEYYIINEFCNGATLFDFLHESEHNISMKVKLSIAKQIAKGMLFLHTNDPPIIHRDLKSLNVLLVNKYNGQPQPQIKIADFGLSRDFASTYMTGTLGTYHWMAPEIFNNEPYSLKADVYSYGIVLWQILSRSPPYTNLKNPQSLMKFITLQNGRPDLNLICIDCPRQIKNLMIRCWDKYPENRPEFKQILQTLNKINL